VEQTALQKSIFNAPPDALPSKSIENGDKPTEAAEPHGTKRAREEEEEDEEAEEVEMEEDDDDASMEEDDDDDDD
jgi:U2 small nuclear ribonucleoprotein B''